MATKSAKAPPMPPFEVTALDAIPGIARRLRETFATNKTKPVEYRLVQLRKLYWAVTDHTEHLKEAMRLDLGKSNYESLLTEIYFATEDLMDTINKLRGWAKDEPYNEVNIAFRFTNPRIRKDPLGPALIIGTYNFPVILNLGPLTGAIAAGCPAVLKPSELAPHTAAVLKEIVEKSLDRDAYEVVNGAVAETTALLHEKWEKIFFTGGEHVGRIIAAKAAETLTPVTLELGGLNPAFVTAHADVALAARRLLWGKTMNAGQVCLSQNYVLADKKTAPALIDELNKQYRVMFPKGAKASPDYARVVNRRHFLRIKKMVDESGGKIVLGGEMDEDQLYIEPTVVLVDSPDDSMVREESFGPVWAILPVDSLDEAIKVANEVHSSPLALFTFGTKAESNKVLDSVLSGGATINDSFFHASSASVPFGGVGRSGSGSYRGRASFDAFTHRRSVAETPKWLDPLLRVRYLPYDGGELARLRLITGKKPNFDRQGREVRGVAYWAKLVLRLGGRGSKGAFRRWLALFVVSCVAAAYSAAARRWLGRS